MLVGVYRTPRFLIGPMSHNGQSRRGASPGTRSLCRGTLHFRNTPGGNERMTLAVIPSTRSYFHLARLRREGRIERHGLGGILSSPRVVKSSLVGGVQANTPSSVTVAHGQKICSCLSRILEWMTDLRTTTVTRNHGRLFANGTRVTVRNGARRSQ